MPEHVKSCDHRWRYFVNLESHAVRVRQCERCGARVVLAAQLERTVEKQSA